MKNNKHYLAGIASFVIWGFISVCLIPLKIYPALDILFYRVFLSSSLLLVLTFIIRRTVYKEQLAILRQMEPAVRRKTIALTLLGGLLLSANWYFYIYVMNTVSIKTAAFAYLICPILTALLATFVLKEKLSNLQWLAVLFSSLSCFVLGMHSAVELLYSMIVAASYAFYLISQRRNGQLDKFVLLTVQITFAALILLPFYPAYSSALPNELSFYLLIIILSVVFTITPLFFNLVALKTVSSSTMGILLYINPLLNFILAFLFFNEQIGLTQVGAYLLILISIFIFNWKAIKSLSAAKS